MGIGGWNLGWNFKIYKHGLLIKTIIFALQFNIRIKTLKNEKSTDFNGSCVLSVVHRL